MSYDWFLGDFLARKMVLVKKTAVDRNTFLSADGDVIKEAYRLGKGFAGTACFGCLTELSIAGINHGDHAECPSGKYMIKQIENAEVDA